MTSEPQFRVYRPNDTAACLALFDANCPAYFAPNERDGYASFLLEKTQGYVVCEQATRIIGAYGLYTLKNGGSALHWILLSPSAQGSGVGSRIMNRVLHELRTREIFPLHISASHKSAPFFAKYGAVELSREMDGWGPGMHRVEMVLRAV